MIKNWEYLREYSEIKDRLFKAVDEVFSSGWLILGSKVKEFEEGLVNTVA
jgi:dTDP-4-amino-4,6-dideoxygalactose transaminase